VGTFKNSRQKNSNSQISSSSPRPIKFGSAAKNQNDFPPR
jgi:hypothetical protein